MSFLVSQREANFPRIGWGAAEKSPIHTVIPREFEAVEIDI